MKSSKIGFYGGVGSVTGANFFIDTGGLKLLVDCGMIQGDQFAEELNQKPFPYDPASIDVLLVTHAHSDHIGRIPKLVKEGFKGKIYSTEPTKALSAVMLEDALEVMIFEEKHQGQSRLYDKEDIESALSLWQTTDYLDTLDLGEGIKASWYDAGHILGSAFVKLERDGQSILFSGDIGNNPQPLLNAPNVPKGAQYVVMESVYGDRSHEEIDTRSELLKEYILEVIKKAGTLIIPAFSLERTQILLFEINNLVEQNQVPAIPVFLDSPLAIAVTEIYRERTKYLKDSVQKQINSGDDIFDFPKLKFTRSVEDSRAIDKTKGPKIVVAGSGMSHGGRVQGHERHYLEDGNNILLLVGYQSVGSIGRRLQDGSKRIKINNQEIRVKAKVATIKGWSGHADREQLTEFVEKCGDQVEKVFVVMGEERASLFLVQRLRDYLGVNALAPSEGEVVELNF